MQLICARCFISPATARSAVGEDASGMVLCYSAPAGYARLLGGPVMQPLRCTYCGQAVEPNPHFRSWYAAA